MHIAFYTNYYLPVVNGVVRSVESFREELAKQGHNVFIFAQTDSEHEDEDPFIYRYPSLNLPLQVDIPAVLPVSSFIDQLLPTLKLDVIHTHHPILLGQTAARKAEELNLPLVFTFHTQYEEYTHYVPLPQEAIQEFLKDQINTWLVDFMRKCQHIVIPSDSIKETLIRDYGLRGRYTVVPTGMDLEPFKQADGKTLRSKMGWDKEKVLISTGRLAQEKNWPVFLQAAQKVHEKHPDLRVVLIGDGPDKEALEEIASELGIADRVTFMGKLPFSDVIAHLKASDVFGFASITETQGLVTMEAMAAGLPVAAVDANGTSDIIDDGKQGYLVANDAEALAEAINRLFDSPRRMAKFRKNALRKAKTFDIKKSAKKMLEVYEQAIQDKADGQYVEVEEVEEIDQEQGEEKTED
ncbi:MAG TPA: glycosyltransferase family 4 protein [Anaerolineales bacterium]|nr:glycosyltransferase family 4 protein [Anaerolineales bacterium]